MKRVKKKSEALAPEIESEVAVELAPFFVGASNTIVSAHDLAAQERWGEACAALRPLAEDVPGSVDLWVQIARWERADGRVEDAAATLEHAIERNENRDRNLLALWHALALQCAEEQQWAQAAQAAQEGAGMARALSYDKRDDGSPSHWASGGELKADRLREHELLEVLGTAYAHEGRFEEAGMAMRELLALSPRDPLHRMRLASLLQSYGALGEASREFERVTQMSPGTFFARDADSALEMLDKAQIQQILTRAGEQRSFGLRLERDMEGTLETHAFYLSESGRESLRQMIDDGRPDLTRAPRLQ